MTPDADDREHAPGFKGQQRPLGSQPEQTTTSLCGQPLVLVLDPAVRAYLPTQISPAKCITDADVTAISEKAVDLTARSIQEGWEEFLAASLVVDLSVLSDDSVFHLYSSAEPLSCLDVLEQQSPSQHFVDLAVGMLISILVVDEQSLCADVNMKGRSLRDSLKGHVITSVKELKHQPNIEDAFEDTVRGKLMECARLNPAFKTGVADLLGTWDQLAADTVADSERRTQEYFSQGEGAAMFADFSEMDEEIKTSASEVVPQAVEIVSSPTNRQHWDDSLASIEALVRGRDVVHLSLSLADKRLDSFAFTQYLYALTETLAAEGFTTFVFEEKRLVPRTLLSGLQQAHDERSLQTLADLTAEYLNAPQGSGVGSLRTYLMLPDADFGPHVAAWLSCVEELRNRVRSNNISVSTAAQRQASPEPAAGRTVHFHGGLIALQPDIPFIRVTPIDPEHGSAGLNSILHKAVERATRRDGFGELLSVGVSQPHINEIFKLTGMSFMSPSEGHPYKLASCCDINLWVFVATDGDEASQQDDPVEVDTNAPVPVGR